MKYMGVMQLPRALQFMFESNLLYYDVMSLIDVIKVINNGIDKDVRNLLKKRNVTFRIS